MIVKELFQSLDLKEIIEQLVLKYPNALKPISEYKENYDIILNTEFSGEGGTITFHPNGDSDAYMIEGDRYFNIVGMEVVLPDSGEVSKAEAAAEILWCAAPFARYPVVDWSVFEEEVADAYALQAKRLDIKMAFPYCRDKEILRALKREMQSSSEDLCLSAEADNWFVSGEGKLWGNRQNRSKRKRLYRMKKRCEELYRLSEIHKELNLLEAKIGYVSENIRQLALSSSSIVKAYYESQTNGKSDRIDYIADLLLNPLYNSKKFLSPDKSQESICVLYTSPEHPCTYDEQNRITNILSKYFGITPWQLFTRQCNSLDKEVELDITFITK
ncbi:MAG: hypothetical protein HDS74_01555 [Bacteroidales bacterium]|nr:hypothetical protein [Bacteroidales bacterium]MBD5211773.1 hypothetical protein [Bacteroidales bacterium]